MRTYYLRYDRLDFVGKVKTTTIFNYKNVSSKQTLVFNPHKWNSRNDVNRTSKSFADFIDIKQYYYRYLLLLFIHI